MEEKPKKSMEEIVYEKLKDAILNRMLSPGTQLIENAVSEKLNASRTPIRNAIKKLASEGLITLIPNRGAFVIQPSKDEILQAFQIRTELESIALKFYLDNFNTTDIEELRLLVNQEASAMKNKDIQEYHIINKQFHMFFAKKSKNVFLIEFIEKIIDRINIYLKLYDTFYNVELEEIESIKEHTEIIQFLLNRDYEGMNIALRNHINKSLSYLNIDRIVYRSLEDLFND